MESNYGDPELAKGLLHLPNGTPSCAGTDVAPIEGVRYIQKDIFKIAYDKRSLSFLSSLLEFRSYLVQSRDLSAHVYRYMGLMWRLSKWHTLELYMWMVGKMLLPSLSLYFGSLVIFNVCHSFFDASQHLLTREVTGRRAFEWTIYSCWDHKGPAISDCGMDDLRGVGISGGSFAVRVNLLSLCAHLILSYLISGFI